MTRTLASRRLDDAQEMLATILHLNEAVFMAAGSPDLTKHATNAIQAVSNEIENKIHILRDRIAEIREEFQ